MTRGEKEERAIAAAVEIIQEYYGVLDDAARRTDDRRARLRLRNKQNEVTAVGFVLKQLLTRRRQARSGEFQAS